jgi:hypothetical protein
MRLTRLRIAVAVVDVAAIVTMIIGSVSGNNNGLVVTAGLSAAVASLVLIGVTAIALPAMGHLDEVLAERVEQRITTLVEAGAADAAVRDLVRDAMAFGRTRP